MSDNNEMLDELEQGAALLHEMAEKVAFWTMVAGHLLMRLEAVSPESHIAITPKFKNIALGLPISFAQIDDETGPTYRLFIQADKESVKLVRQDETERRKANGIGIEVVIKVGPKVEKSGLVDITGKDIESVKRDAAKPSDTRTTGEVR